MMNDGFRLRVTIQSAPETRSATGAISYDWANPVEVGQRWARFVPKGGRESAAGNILQSSADVEIEIKGKLAVTPKMRLVQDGRIFDIVAAQGVDGKKPVNAAIIRLRCREESRKTSL